MAKLNKTPFTIRVRRGTVAQITATSPAPYQVEGELAYATDTKQLYISDGTAFRKMIAEIDGVGTGGTFTTADGKTVTYSAGGQITNVV